MVNSTYLGLCMVDNQPTDPISICIATMYILFGIVYTLFGYRCFKAVMFLTGFIFASVIVYLICIQEKRFPTYANAGIAISAGLLFGLITMLVQYFGLFMTGFHTGLAVAIAGLVAADQLNSPPSTLTSVASLLGVGTLFAVLNLYWQKGLTIFGTCVYGGGLVTFSVDYLSELLRTVEWLWKRQGPPCYPVLALWPAVLFLGLAVQISLTPHHHHHNAKHGGRGARTREQRAELRQNKYRYLYQVRTAHGDIISQNYVQAIQNKVVGPGETSTLESDATHLTMLPDGQTDFSRGNYYR
ncbi:transmembrane protein 198 [Halyomorpha halys]|uniref:transmembrane protein 198 n=1 Tax=Halyomorpha halys TaxID=286706 RepID=UPI0006D4F6F9|nr:transmembrane protein 198 [Halyomorpha halys]